MKKKLLSTLLAVCLLLGLISALAPPPLAASGADAGLAFGRTISAGKSHMAVIKKDGTLWTWGRNVDNRLGIGAAGDAVTTPVQVPVSKVLSVSAGYDTTSAITENGELWNWGGDDLLGALGREAKGENVGPGKVMDGVRSVSSSGFHSGAITRSGTLWVWRRNNAGQLGNNRQGTIAEGVHRNYIYEPLPVRAMEGVRAVETSAYGRTFAILTDDSLWGWGSNERGAGQRHQRVERGQARRQPAGRPRPLGRGV